jgi:hypothetical protein
MRLPKPNADVIYRAVEGGAVLLSSKDEVYYGLNTVGQHIWEHLPPVLQTSEELVTSLSSVYPDAPIETIRADARELLAELLANRLVSPLAGTDHATSQSPAAQETDQVAAQPVG